MISVIDHLQTVPVFISLDDCFCRLFRRSFRSLFHGTVLNYSSVDSLLSIDREPYSFAGLLPSFYTRHYGAEEMKNPQPFAIARVEDMSGG